MDVSSEVYGCDVLRRNSLLPGGGRMNALLQMRKACLRGLEYVFRRGAIPQVVVSDPPV